jgi:hypothetical protein
MAGAEGSPGLRRCGRWQSSAARTRLGGSLMSFPSRYDNFIGATGWHPGRAGRGFCEVASFDEADVDKALGAVNVDTSQPIPTQHRV